MEADGRKIPFDMGARPNTVLENGKAFKVDFTDVQDVVLSHFHYDRTTRLITLRHEFAKSNPRAFSHVHVGKGIFLPRRGAMDHPLIAAKKEYETTGGMFLEHDKPEEILLAGVWLTGSVPRVYPEQNDPRGVPFAKGDRWVEADVPDDQSLVFNTPRGLVLLTGCGHAGIINTLQYARAFLRRAPVEAAIGGFHLFRAHDAQLDGTADKLKEFQTAQILGAHSTGVESVHHLSGRAGLDPRSCRVGTVGAAYGLKEGIQTGPLAR